MFLDTRTPLRWVLHRLARQPTERARRLIYLEDQYLWSFHATGVLCETLRREPELLLVIVIPRVAFLTLWALRPTSKG